MQTPMDAMLGLVIAAIGLMTFVVALILQDPKRQIVGIVVSVIVLITGLTYFTSAQMRGYRMRKRITEIQNRQQINLNDIQKRLKRNQSERTAPPKTLKRLAGRMELLPHEPWPDLNR